MVQILKSGEKKRKEPKGTKLKRQYDAHTKRLDDLKEKDMYDEYIDGHKSGRSIARRAEVSQLANTLDTPPHDLKQFKAGCAQYFKDIEDKTKVHITKEGVVVEVSDDSYPMTIEGLLCHLGISYYWWNKYESGDGYENYHEIAQASKMTITKSILEGGLTNKLNAKLSVFYLQNISTLRERPVDSSETGVHTINFITVNNKKELQDMKSGEEEIHDAEIVEDEP